ncbi:MAG TPA: HD domain-containing protein [Nitrososphaerales archaeon]|nr:HD domain-containing protein [Nitrososphaerales archaeon]
MILKPVAEIRDPVHGYVKVTEVERDLVDSPFVQRLRRVHQLAGSYLVFPGAVHTRFEHVIGTMHLAGEVAESLSSDSGLAKDQVQEIRLAALLHDVGHGPFSHMYEEVLGEKSGTTHEDISQRIVRETTVGDILERHGFSAKKMSSFAVGKQSNRPRFMNEIIAGGLSADIMDYLLRDSYFTGVEYGRVDVRRIVDSLRTADGRLVLDEAALHAFEALLLARYQMFKAVYFHRTVRAAELMLVHSMKLADEALGLTDLSDLDRYLDLTDEVVLHKLASLDQSTTELKEARRLAVDFLNRRLVKCVFERLVLRRDRVVEQLFDRGRLRDQVESDVAERAKVDRMHVYLDVPTTPSVPYTSSREALTQIRVSRREGKRTTVTAIPISELPLVGSIAGFMDVIRVYTTQEHRKSVERATGQLLGDENYMTRISV